MALPRPTRHFWTYEDLLALPDDGKRYEIIHGDLIEMTGPNWDHGTVVYNLVLLLGPLVQTLCGLLRQAPLDVFLGRNVVQPDLFAILPGGAARPERNGLRGAPDLVIKVLSPGNRDHDRRRKRATYRDFGVSEYWIVDPETRSVEVLRLQDSDHTVETITGDAVIASTLLPGASLPLAAIFADLEGIEH